MAETKLVGIVNVTPDSFSDGGAHFTPDAALFAIAHLIKDGADIIDIGAESTRPGAQALTHDQEWRRLKPVLERLADFTGAVFSVDTRHAATAKNALALGIGWVNDVSGLADPAMVEAVRESDCKLVVMHSLSVPADTSHVLPQSVDVVQALLEFARARISALVEAGIARSRLIFDPGIGFGKNPAQSMMILRAIKQLESLSVPLLVGHSRKSFLAGYEGDNPGARDDATLIASQYLAEQGVAYLRVHDVARHKRMLALSESLHG